MTALPASDHRIRRAAIEALGRLEDVPSEFIELDGGWVGVAAQLDGTRWVTTVDADTRRPVPWRSNLTWACSRGGSLIRP